MTDSVSRRTLLGALAGAGVTSVAGCSFFEPGEDASTTDVDEERAQALAVEYAPTFYFDRNEKWFPTDPSSYESNGDDGVVVNGFDALNGYTARTDDTRAPEPTVFYHVVEYEASPLVSVQYWCYSAFDQFTTNFHWHDWELFQAFVDVSDTGTPQDDGSMGDPQLYVASSHSRSVPNNEFLDPDASQVPRILTELGSHSSALSIADAQFDRLPGSEGLADITNGVVDTIEAIATIPLAYGLPRDEGLRLPYLVPELDDAPLYEHDRLPDVESADLIDESLTVRSFADLASPPTALPERENGIRFQHTARDAADPDIEYDLVPASELEHIEAFTGPQLSYEFAVPGFAEDSLAGHITTTGVPWKQGRYENPAADITEAAHRSALADRYEAIGEPGPINRVVARVTSAVESDDAPEDAGLTTEGSTVETVALVESEPEAVPTFAGGVAVIRDVPPGDHRLTVNGAGVAPHSETVSVTDGPEPNVGGVEGEVPLVARERATKLAVGDGADSDLSRLAVEDDFAGRLYDAPVDGPDAVYVHDGGAYTTEVRDTTDAIGAFRVNPDDQSGVTIDEPRTGKASLASFLADIAAETRADVAAVAETDSTGDSGGGAPSATGPSNAVRGLTQALEAVVEAAQRATERAEAGDRGGADERLAAVATRLERVSERLAAARDDLPPGIARASGHRLDQATRRARQAREAEKL